MTSKGTVHSRPAKPTTTSSTPSPRRPPATHFRSGADCGTAPGRDPDPRVQWRRQQLGMAGGGNDGPRSQDSGGHRRWNHQHPACQSRTQVTKSYSGHPPLPCWPANARWPRLLSPSRPSLPSAQVPASQPHLRGPFKQTSRTSAPHHPAGSGLPSGENRGIPKKVRRSQPGIVDHRTFRDHGRATAWGILHP